MRRQGLAPAALGALMAAVMLLMLHTRIMSGEDIRLSAFLTFIGAHLGVAAVLAAAALMFPKARRVLKAHKPSYTHMVLMLTGALLSGGAIHLVVHPLVGGA